MLRKCYVADGLGEFEEEPGPLCPRTLFSRVGAALFVYYRFGVSL